MRENQFCCGLTVFNEADNGAVLHRDIHVEVLNVNVHLADSSLVRNALGLQLARNILKKGDLLGIFSNAFHVPINLQIRLYFNRNYLLVNLQELVGDLGVEVSNGLFAFGQVVNDPLEDAFETLGGVLQSENCFEVEGTLECYPIR